MKVTVNGRDYSVWFRYLFAGDTRYRVCTVATIAEVHDYEGWQEKNVNVVAEGKTFCHPNDQYQKKIGRKIAFDRAVNKLFIGRSPNLKAARRVFWNAFLEKCKVA